MTEDPAAPKSRPPFSGRWTRVLLLSLALGLGAYLLRDVPVQENLKRLLEWIGGLGLWAPLIFIVVYIFATVAFLPGSVLTVGAGFLFGVVQGSLVVSAASTLGATAAFLLGRYGARDWVAGKIAGNDRFQAIDQAVGKEGWKIVGLTRLSPVFPFNLLNYAFGLTRVSLRHYILASWIGMMPATVLYVYVGSLAGNLGTLGTSDRPPSTAEWVIRILGLAATVGVTVYVTRIARRALHGELKPAAGAKS